MTRTLAPDIFEATRAAPAWGRDVSPAALVRLALNMRRVEVKPHSICEPSWTLALRRRDSMAKLDAESLDRHCEEPSAAVL
jgi:hypothetical protein